MLILGIDVAFCTAFAGAWLIIGALHLAARRSYEGLWQ